MNVMVTGATTPLGASIVRALAAAPEIGLVLAVGYGPHAGFSGDAKVVYRATDLTRARALHDLLAGDARDYNITTVIHGMQHRRAADEGRQVHAQNVTATRELALHCLDHPTIRRLIHRSFAEVYLLDSTASNLLDEDAALDFEPGSPQWVRDRVEADLTVCAHFGETLEIAVLRCADIFAAGTGSQL